jgi:predicted GNAT family N-acyltransferase
MYEVIKFEVNNHDLAEIVFGIRQKVFVLEQKVSPEEEYDEFEAVAQHFLLKIDGVPAGTSRWRFTEGGRKIKLERFAVLPEFRNRGAGTSLVREVLADVLPHNLPVYLHAQVPAMNLYARAGFKMEGDLFYEAGIPHYKMIFRG